MTESAIVETRFLDIPYEEAVRCVEGCTDYQKAREQWESMRGKPVRIHVPACEADKREHQKLCDGPFFQIVSNSPFCVCPHVIEIGD